MFMDTTALTLFVVFGAINLIYVALLLCVQSLFLLIQKYFFPKYAIIRRDKVQKFLKIWMCTISLILGFGLIIVPLSYAFSWIIGVGAGLIAGATIFALVYLITKLFKK